MSSSSRSSGGPGEGWRVSTLAVHGGEHKQPVAVADSVTTPIALTSTYHFRDTQQVIDYQEGRYSSFEYGRYGNPTVAVAEKKLAVLEGAEACLLSASGMNAVTTMLLSLVPAGGHIVTTSDCYRRTRQFMTTVLPRMGVQTTVIEPGDMDALTRALERETCLFFSESPTNPYLRVVDIPKTADLCHARGVLVVIDGTFATPINQRCLDLGADLVLHSATKYLAGHNDLLGGALLGSHELVDRVRKTHDVLGGIMAPQVAYLLVRSLKTLPLRIARHNSNGLALATYLSRHEKVTRVHYPGLPDHPDHAVASAQMGGFGGVVSFEVRGDRLAASRFIDALALPYIAPSLGAVESLAEQPMVISYWDYSDEERARLGIADTLIRYACGIEDADDIIDDVARALDQV